MKKMILLLILIIGLSSTGGTAFAEESQVEVQVNTRDEKGYIHEGTENIKLSIYDLTDWRFKRTSDEKKDKEYILNTYSTKDKLTEFVKDEQLKKISETSFVLDEKGSLKINLPRYQNERDAAYLILSMGETGKYQMLPIIVYLPQILTNSKEESFFLVYNSKYLEIMSTESSTTQTESTEQSITNSLESKKNLSLIAGTSNNREGEQNHFSEKDFPATNELIRNFYFLGILLMIFGLVGLVKNSKGKKNYEKQK